MGDSGFVSWNLGFLGCSAYWQAGYYHADQIVAIMPMPCEKPLGGYTNWWLVRIAKAVGISQRRIHQNLKDAELKLQKTKYWCGKSPDPEFESKMMNNVVL